MLLFATPSGAHAASQRTDPTADSPAGVIYQIPLDSGRRDAAPLPKRGGNGNGTNNGTGAPGAGSGGSGGSGGPGGSAGAGGSTGSGTAGTGSGSTGSGVAGSGAGGSAGGGSSPNVATGAGGGTLPGGATPDDPSSIHSENGFGSSSRVPGLDAPAPVAADAKGGGGSSAPVYLLLALIAGLAVWVGTSAARTARRV